RMRSAAAAKCRDGFRRSDVSRDFTDIRFRRGIATYVAPATAAPHHGEHMTDTIFDQIIRREIPADIVFEDEHLIAFRDIAPQAPVHVLFVPKAPIATLNDLAPEQAVVIGRLAYAAAQYAEREGFAED